MRLRWLWTYQQRFIKCRKPRCRCAEGKGHGPYWYGFRRRSDGRVESKYFGKQRPWHSPEDERKAVYISALRLFGFTKLRRHPVYKEIEQRYTALSIRARADNERMRRLKAASEILKFGRIVTPNL
jgi:hypothetical protein